MDYNILYEENQKKVNFRTTSCYEFIREKERQRKLGRTVLRCVAEDEEKEKLRKKLSLNFKERKRIRECVKNLEKVQEERRKAYKGGEDE